MYAPVHIVAHLEVDRVAEVAGLEQLYGVLRRDLVDVGHEYEGADMWREFGEVPANEACHVVACVRLDIECRLAFC